MRKYFFILVLSYIALSINSFAAINVIKTEYLDKFGEIKYSPDGTLGYVYRNKVSSSSYKLIYRIINPDGSITDSEVDSASTSDYFQTNHLLYDFFGNPNIVAVQKKSVNSVLTAFFSIYTKSGDQWIKNSVSIDPLNIAYSTATISFDNSIHILGTTPGDYFTSVDFYVYYITNRGGVWKYEIIEHSAREYSGIETGVERERPDFDIVTDVNGAVHVVYGIAYKADLGDGYDFCSVLRYATNKSGVWQAENVFPDYYFFKNGKGYDPTLSISSDGTPALASTYMERSWTGGSLGDAELVFSYRKPTGGWQSTSIMKTSDGFNGNDGTGFTGAQPMIALNNLNKVNILFLDYASFHVPYNHVYQGQIRYGYNPGTGYNFTKIFQQASPTMTSPDTLLTSHEIHEPNLVISPSGKDIHIFAIQRDTENGQDNYTEKYLHIYAQNTDVGSLKNARFLYQDVPANMYAGSKYNVTLIMQNTGTEDWAETPSNPYRLASQNPTDNDIWGVGSRVVLGGGETIIPGMVKNFQFEVTAPSTPGQYNFQWRMVHEGVEFFGDTTPNLVIDVIQGQPVTAGQIAGYLLSKNSLIDPEKASADKNGDGKIDIADVVRSIAK